MGQVFCVDLDDALRVCGAIDPALVIGCDAVSKADGVAALHADFGGALSHRFGWVVADDAFAAQPDALCDINRDPVGLVAHGDALFDAAVAGFAIANLDIARRIIDALFGIKTSKVALLAIEAPVWTRNPEVAFFIQREAVRAHGGGGRQEDLAGLAVELPDGAVVEAANPNNRIDFFIGADILGGHGADQATVAKALVPCDAFIFAPVLDVCRACRCGDGAIVVGVDALAEDFARRARAAVADVNITKSIDRCTRGVIACAIRAGVVAGQLHICGGVDLGDRPLGGVGNPNDLVVCANRVDLQRDFAVGVDHHALRIARVGIHHKWIAIAWSLTTLLAIGIAIATLADGRAAIVAVVGVVLVVGVIGVVLIVFVVGVVRVVAVVPRVILGVVGRRGRWATGDRKTQTRYHAQGFDCAAGVVAHRALHLYSIRASSTYLSMFLL